MQQQEQQRDAGSPRPTQSAVDAAVSLLGDPDPRIFHACRQQLRQWGAAAHASLARASDHADPRLRLRARRLLRGIALDEWLRSLHEIARRFRTDAPDRSRFAVLDTTAWLLSSVADPTRDLVAEFGPRLDQLADRLRRRLTVRTAAASARALAEVMASEEGLTGDSASYYELDNLLLHSVLEQRKGVPVSLCLLYLMVGRRAGLSLSGVRMPDHFLVRVHGARPVLLDPFHGGRTVTRTDCIRYLRSAGYATDARSLAEVDDETVLRSLVVDLQRVFGFREDRDVCEALGEAAGVLASGS